MGNARGWLTRFMRSSKAMPSADSTKVMWMMIYSISLSLLMTGTPTKALSR
jgi:hypothetical protein